MSVASKLVSDFCGLTVVEKTSLIIPQNIKNPQIKKLGQNYECFTEYIDESKKEAIRNAFPKLESHNRRNKGLNAGNLAFNAFLTLIGLIFVLSA